MDELSLAQLLTFTRAVALGSLSALARERSVPVSQVSRTIDRIERACGARLLRRSSRGLSLTHDGEQFLAFCQQVGDNRATLDAALAQARGQVSGRLRLSLSALLAEHWLLPSLPALTRQHPQLALDLVVDDELVDLARHGIDVAVRTGTPTTLSLVARPLGRIRTGLFASAAYLARHGVPQDVDDLRQHHLLANCAHPVLNRLCFTRGRVLMADGAMRASSTALLARMVAAGQGIAQLPLQVARAWAAPAPEALQPVLAADFEPLSVDVHAILPPDRQRQPRVRACLDHLVRVFDAPAFAAPPP